MARLSTTIMRDLPPQPRAFYAVAAVAVVVVAAVVIRLPPVIRSKVKGWL